MISTLVYLSLFDASLYDDSESFLPLESNVVDGAPLTDLEEVFDPPSTSLPFLAPSFSNTPMDTSVGDLTLLASPLPLAQCISHLLAMGEIFRGGASSIKEYSLSWLKELTFVKLYIEEAPFEEFCGDIMMGSVLPSIGSIDPICIKTFDLTPISSPLLPTTPLNCMHLSL